MAVDLTPVLTEYLASNLGPNPADPRRRQRPNYGVAANLIDGVLHVELTFRGGSAFCCRESGCHLDLRPGKRWDRLRLRLNTVGISAPEQMELRLTCVVEDGAMFFDFFRPDPARKGWYAFAPATATRYEVTKAEAPPTE